GGGQVEGGAGVVGEDALAPAGDGQKLGRRRPADLGEDLILAVSHRDHGDIIRAMISARPAGFWIRVVAALIDFAVFGLVQLSFRLIGAKLVGPDAQSVASFKPIVTFFTLVFPGAYTTVPHAFGGPPTGTP